MKFKDYFLNKITEILGTYFVLFLMLEFLYIIGNTFSVVFMIGVVIAILIMTKYLMDWYRKKKYFEQRKIYKFYKCPMCKQEGRVPRGHGKICITCPKCREEFIRRS